MRTTLFILFLTTQGVLLGYHGKTKNEPGGAKATKATGRKEAPSFRLKRNQNERGSPVSSSNARKKTEYRSEVSKKYKGN
jgi:hypothetical protein